MPGTARQEATDAWRIRWAYGKLIEQFGVEVLLGNTVHQGVHFAHRRLALSLGLRFWNPRRYQLCHRHKPVETMVKELADSATRCFTLAVTVGSMKVSADGKA